MPGKSKFGPKLITPKARLGYHAIFEPDQGQYADPKKPYKAQLLFDKSDQAVIADLKLIKKACVKLATEAFGADAKVAMPFRDGDEVFAEKGKPEWVKGMMIINPKSKYRPNVCDAKVQKLTELGDLYVGAYVRASIVPFSYEGKEKGISFILNNIQKVADAEPLGGGGPARAEDDFEAYAGSTAAEIEDDSDIPF